jgi:DNA topoisomerase III
MRSDTISTDGGSLKVACPKCLGNLRENQNRIQCQSCDFGLWRIIANRRFGTSELEELISKGRIGPFADFRGKTGKHFAATIKLAPDLKLEFDFGPNNLDKSETS